MGCESLSWSITGVSDVECVQLLSAGIDEAPGVYNIDNVMAAQSDLVDFVARFDPKIVKMADAGEKPED
jgi:tRNA-splicing ligase RtcB